LAVARRKGGEGGREKEREGGKERGEKKRVRLLPCQKDGRREGRGGREGGRTSRRTCGVRKEHDLMVGRVHHPGLARDDADGDPRLAHSGHLLRERGREGGRGRGKARG